MLKLVSEFNCTTRIGQGLGGTGCKYQYYWARAPPNLKPWLYNRATLPIIVATQSVLYTQLHNIITISILTVEAVSLDAPAVVYCQGDEDKVDQHGYH